MASCVSNSRKGSCSSFSASTLKGQGLDTTELLLQLSAAENEQGVLYHMKISLFAKRASFSDLSESDPCEREELSWSPWLHTGSILAATYCLNKTCKDPTFQMLR